MKHQLFKWKVDVFSLQMVITPTIFEVLVITEILHLGLLLIINSTEPVQITLG